jgi:hypothetical protein
MRHTILLLVLAIVLTLVSSLVTRTRLETQDWDCPPPPTSCARPVLVLGFPWPFISDYHGISPVGSASLVGAALGIDHFHARAFLLNVGSYFFCLLVIAAGRSRSRRVVQHGSGRETRETAKHIREGP